jgi:hypothetical protein
MLTDQRSSSTDLASLQKEMPRIVSEAYDGASVSSAEAGFSRLFHFFPFRFKLEGTLNNVE